MVPAIFSDSKIITKGGTALLMVEDYDIADESVFDGCTWKVKGVGKHPGKAVIENIKTSTRQKVYSTNNNRTVYIKGIKAGDIVVSYGRSRLKLYVSDISFSLSCDGLQKGAVTLEKDKVLDVKAVIKNSGKKKVKAGKINWSLKDDWSGIVTGLNRQSFTRADITPDGGKCRVTLKENGSAPVDLIARCRINGHEYTAKIVIRSNGFDTQNSKVIYDDTPQKIELKDPSPSDPDNNDNDIDLPDPQKVQPLAPSEVTY